jgi:hypothetical protein
MWPPEHLALGYLLYSVSDRVLSEDRPTDATALVLAFATQLPDLVDKPLAWTFGVLPGGLTLAHSLFTAVPVCVAVYLITRWRTKRDLGVAFAVGYGSHLLGDMLYALLTGGGLAYRFLFWPLLGRQVGEETSFAGEFSTLVADFGSFLVTPRGTLYLLFEAFFLGVTFLLWLSDGRPGPGVLRRTAGASDDRG